MDLIQAMNERHSVRAYLDKKIEGETLKALQEEIAKLNKESSLNMQLIIDEDKAFGGRMAHYGSFRNVKNYIAVVGEKSSDLSERAGYYGEKLVLFAQTLGLNTCWVAMSYSKGKVAYDLEKGEKLALVIAIGYGQTQGVAHRSRSMEEVSKSDVTPAPDWFVNGVKAALLAPTAINQQKFSFELKDGKVVAKAGIGFYTNIDLGIAKCHFEIGSGRKI